MRDRETTESIAFELEQLIDENSLSGVLEIIARVCREKADHIASNWGDHVASRAWTSTANKVDKIASRIDI